MNDRKMTNRWLINRIGLINFWYYDEEEFEFSNGRLLLRGANGSGKSVTMQSFIPLLLDGNKSPERLDPFGSRARRIENYLLGEDDMGENERTGYLFMEFKRQHTQQYLSLGMGLRARRGRSLDSWGFALTDGRRIGRDFFLYKRLAGKIPLSKQELKNRIGEGGELYERQGEYMAMVNRLLFGYEQLGDYDELIKLLIQIRTPKLSKDYKPTVIYEILTNSLQALSDEDLRPMSEAIENMDNIKDRLVHLHESKNAMDRLKRKFDGYNKYLLWEKARDFLLSNEEVEKTKKEEERLQEEIVNLEVMRRKAREELNQLITEQETVQAEHRKLLGHESYRLREEIAERENNRAQWAKEKGQKKETLDEKVQREKRLAWQIKEMKDELGQLNSSVACGISQMATLAQELYFEEHFLMEAELAQDFKKDHDWAFFKHDFQMYRDKVNRSLQKMRIEREEQKRYDQAYGELEKAKGLLDEARTAKDRGENLLAETKEEFIEAAYGWRENNLLLKPGNEKMREIQGSVNEYPRTGYDDILAPLRLYRDEYENGLRKNLSDWQAQKEFKQEKKEEKEAELKLWLAKEEPEPARSEAVIRNRSKLKEQGIPFIPFYQAVDFKEDVEDELKGKIEEVLKKLGVLDALIVPAIYKDKLWEMDSLSEDAYLFPQIQLFSLDLSAWLKSVSKPGQNIATGLIDLIIRSIATDNRDSFLFLQETGRYGVGGILEGQVASGYRPKFLGIEARRRYREETIGVLRQDILSIEQEIGLLEQKIKENEHLLFLSDEEFRNFPAKEDLEAAAALAHMTQLALEDRQRAVEEKNKSANTHYGQWENTREEVRLSAKDLQIPLNISSFEKAWESLTVYGTALSELEKNHSIILVRHSYLDSLEGQMADLQVDLDHLRSDLVQLSYRIDKEIGFIAGLREALARTDFKDIEERVNKCIARMEEIPGLRDQAAAKESRKTIKGEETRKQLEELKKRLCFLVKLEEIKCGGFLAEQDLGYVEIIAGDPNPVNRAKVILEELGVWAERIKSSADYESSLQETYFEVRPQLAEFNLNLTRIFPGGKHDLELDLARGSESMMSKKEFGKEEMAELNKITGNLRRIDIGARIQGLDANFYALAKFLTDSIGENEKLLQESDRLLFEDILVNTISKKIRARIYHSERWVEKMNRLMASMNISSGLTFNLVWKSKPAESEGQIDTNELVALLKSDAILLRPEDFQKLAAHFRSKITRAREALEEAGVTKTFHTLIREVLDYRQWFEFQLFYTKTGERKRELTDNAFHRFSGGEKAMAMYVPLFSAVYAKYEGARADSPRLLSLDEAFAGVDENNIRDMFKLLEELNLNFIINSQILWGDYDTVPSLSICELVRPNNANYVSVIRYLWNGEVKSLVDKGAVGWE